MISWNPFKKAKPSAARPVTAEDHLAPNAPFNPDNFAPWHGFRKLTPTVLTGVHDQDLQRAISNHVRLKEDEVRRLGRTLSHQDFTREVLLLNAVWVLEAEVRNGAFTQYFHRQDAQAVRDAMAGLEMIGAVESLRTLRDAIGLFSYHYEYLLPLIDEFRLSRPEERPESETATHDFHVHQAHLDICRVKFIRSMSASQLARSEA